MVFKAGFFQEAAAGDLVLTRGRHWRSRAVQAMDPGKGFTHIGILAEAEGRLWVVHASPDAGVARVQIESLSDFLENPQLEALQVRRFLPRVGPRAEAAAEAALEMGRRGLPFDGHFDLDSEETVYCSELIWRAYKASGVDLLDGIDWQERVPLLKPPLLMPSTFSKHPQFATVLDLTQP